jgi:hypothetical protein
MRRSQTDAYRNLSDIELIRASQVAAIESRAHDVGVEENATATTQYSPLVDGMFTVPAIQK